MYLEETQYASNLFLAIEATSEPFEYLGPQVGKVKQLVRGATKSERI